MFKKTICFSFIWFHSICRFLFYLNTAWRRIAVDIKVKVKRHGAYRVFKSYGKEGKLKRPAPPTRWYRYNRCDVRSIDWWENFLTVTTLMLSCSCISLVDRIQALCNIQYPSVYFWTQPGICFANPLGEPWKLTRSSFKMLVAKACFWLGDFVELLF